MVQNGQLYKPHEFVPLTMADWAKVDMWPKQGQSYLVFFENAFKTQEPSQIFVGYTMMLSEIRGGTIEIKASQQSLHNGGAKAKIFDEGTIPHRRKWGKQRSEAK